MKTRLYIVIDNLAAGGTQRQVIEYLKHADSGRFQIKIINLDKGRTTLSDEIETLGCEIISIGHKGFFNVSTIMRLRNLFKQEAPDIVHTYLFTADLYGRIAAKMAGVPVIISSIRNMDLWKTWHHRAVDRILAKITDRITINAEIIRPYLVKDGILREKIVTIYNGVDLTRFDNLRLARDIRQELNIPQDGVVVGMVGRFAAQKDYATFFAAAENVAEKAPNVYFMAVGDGPLIEAHRSWVVGRRIEKRVIFTGLRRDVPDLINAMDICVLSSHYEGCPNVVMEYMACSKPVIASDVGGCTELIVNGKTGFIVPKADVSALTDKMMALINDPQLRRSMGEKGRSRIENGFTAEIMAKNTEALYDDLTKPRLAFLMSQFPETHETFIVRELRALEETMDVRRGTKDVCGGEERFEIFSLKRCRDKVIHPEARGLMERTVYGRISWVVGSIGSIGSLGLWGLLHPVRSLSSLGYVMRTYLSNPKELAKALYIWLECMYFAKVIKERRITHIHAHWATLPTTAAVILSKLTGVTFSFTAHAWDIFVSQAGLREKIERAEFVVTCTEYNQKYLNKLMDNDPKVHKCINAAVHKFDKIHLNYHGLEKGWFNADQRPKTIDQRPLKILAIGRLVEQKGFEHLAEACRILRERGVDFKCTIVGEGPLKGKLAAYGSVELAGMKTQEEIKRLYHDAAVFVAPSVVAENGDRDGIPNVLLEAMAIGVPVIGTAVSGLPEVIIDGVTGLSVPERDSAALADAIERIARDPALGTRLAGAARKLVEENFDAERNAMKLVELFEGRRARGEKREARGEEGREKIEKIYANTEV